MLIRAGPNVQPVPFGQRTYAGLSRGRSPRRTSGRIHDTISVQAMIGGQWLSSPQPVSSPSSPVRTPGRVTELRWIGKENCITNAVGIALTYLGRGLVLRG